MELRKTREKEFYDDPDLSNRRQGFSKILYSSQLTEPVTKYFWEKIGNPNNKQILDYGCGTGSNSIKLASQGANVVGIDISSLRISKAEQSAKKYGLSVKFVEGDAEGTDFENNTFDIIIGGAILHHLNLDSAAKEIHRILKPGGTAVFIEPLGMNPFINVFRKLTPEARSADEHPFKISDFGILHKYFSEIEINYFILFSLLHVPIRIILKRDINAFLHFLQQLDDKILKVQFLQRFAWQVVLVLHKK